MFSIFMFNLNNFEIILQLNYIFKIVGYIVDYNFVKSLYPFDLLDEQQNNIKVLGYVFCSIFY